MKNLKYISYKYLAILFTAVSFTACSEDAMDRVNKDNDHTQDVPAKFILTDVITRTAFYGTGGDFNTYLSTYVEHEVGTHNQLFRAEHRQTEPSAASTFNNAWGHLYTNLKNARIIIDKCSEGGSQEGNYITKGIAQVMAAYNSALLTDMFGDTPWIQAALIKEDGTPLYMTPVVDNQEVIYSGILEYLDEAIANLQKSDEHVSGTVGLYDLMYTGNTNKWVQFAYGLKARYTMRLMVRSGDLNNQMEKVIEYVDKSFTSASDQAAFAIYDASNLNPLFDFYWSRYALAASQSMADKLIERNDPRFRRVFADADGDQIVDENDKNMAPNGKNEELIFYYNTSSFVYAQTAPTLLLSYHEAMFLKAEALCRLGRIEEAEDVLKNAFLAGIANMENSIVAAKATWLEENSEAISIEEAMKYFDSCIQPAFKANPLKEVMFQKYLAFFGASGESVECYNDIRRMKALREEFIELKNPNKLPLRCPYGIDDTTANPNVKELYGDGQYVYTENVWWAAGSR